MLKIAIPIIVAVLAALVLTGALLIASLRKLNSNERRLLYMRWLSVYWAYDWNSDSSRHQIRQHRQEIEQQCGCWGSPRWSTWIQLHQIPKRLSDHGVSRYNCKLLQPLVVNLEAWMNGLIGPLLLKCLNKDGVIIDLDVSYQFKAKWVDWSVWVDLVKTRLANMWSLYSAKYMRTLIDQFKNFEGYKKVLLASGKKAKVLKEDWRVQED